MNMPEPLYLPCPACRTPLPPEATGCQICMRSRTKQEIVRGYAKLRDDKARRKRFPLLILAALALVGVSGKLFWTWGGPIRSAADSASARLARWADEQRDPKNYGYKEAGPPAASAPAVSVAAAPPVAAPPPPPATFAAGAPPDVSRPAKKAAPVNAWRISGTVYDLSTLSPVHGAAITFELDGAEPVHATSDDRGAYEVDLPKADGWIVSLWAPRHRPGQLMELDPPFRDRDADERRAAMNALSESDLMPVPVSWSRKAMKARLDLVAVPLPGHGPL